MTSETNLFLRHCQVQRRHIALRLRHMTDRAQSRHCGVYGFSGDFFDVTGYALRIFGKNSGMLDRLRHCRKEQQYRGSSKEGALHGRRVIVRMRAPSVITRNLLVPGRTLGNDRGIIVGNGAHLAYLQLVVCANTRPIKMIRPLLANRRNLDGSGAAVAQALAGCGLELFRKTHGNGGEVIIAATDGQVIGSQTRIRAHELFLDFLRRHRRHLSGSGEP